MKYLKTLNAIHAKLGRLGDLPVFSATVNHIQQISSSKESDAMALAMAIMKDANLSARLLRLANSTYYNRNSSRINVISRAVIMIGFDEIKNLSFTLKLVEAFNKTNPNTDVTALLMRSFLTAAISRELGIQANIDDIEETYTCGLLHGLGEIIFACTLSEEYNRLLSLHNGSDKPWKRIQLDEIGGHFSDIGQELAQSWGFPPNVVHSMDAMTADAPKGHTLRNFEITSTVDKTLQLIYGRGKPGAIDFNDLIDKLATITGISMEKVNQAMGRGFKMVCDMATDYNLPSTGLNPPLRDSGDEALDEFARKASYYMHSQSQSGQGDIPESTASKAQPLEHPSERAKMQLDYLHEISELVNQNTPTPQLLKKVIEGIVTSTACDRAAFVMLSKDRKQLILRLGEGNCVEDLRSYFDIRTGEGDDFFFKVLSKQMTLLVTDSQEGGWNDRLPESFLAQVNPHGFIMAPLLAKRQAIGFLYADRLIESGAIDQEDFRSFNQFYMQAKMALAYSSQQSAEQ